MSFSDALVTREAVRSALEAAGIKAKAVVVLGDSGPRVDVFVTPKDLDRAKKALPADSASGSVFLHKAVPPQP